MSVRMRHTKAHTRNRRSHHHAEKATLTRDKDTGDVSVRHRVSPTTGMYKGRQVIDVNKRAEKREKRKEDKNLNSANAESGKEEKASTSAKALAGGPELTPEGLPKK